jgi:uncharacterized protein DUF3237
MQLSAELSDAQILGDAPLGTRRIMYMKHGAFSGPRLKGQVLPGGGDWVLLRPDGVAELDIRLTLRTDEGELIYVSCDGIFDITPDARQRILKGEDIDPSEYYFRTAPRFETGSQKYLWLNRLLTVGVARRTTAGMVTDIFAVK